MVAGWDLLARRESGPAGDKGRILIMTPDQARIVLLEDALVDAQHLVEFLHGCLMDTNYSYAYPQHTQERLDEWRALAKPLRGCPHSFHRADCPACREHAAWLKRHHEARRVLKLS